MENHRIHGPISYLLQLESQRKGQFSPLWTPFTTSLITIQFLSFKTQVRQASVLLSEKTYELVSYVCCNKLAQTWWLKTEEFILSQFWKTEAEIKVCQQDHAPEGSSRESFFASSSFWWLFG